MNWEGVAAEGDGVRLTTFKMSDFNIPYSYSPVIVASEDNIASKEVEYSKFLSATKKGFLDAIENAEEAAKILQKQVAKSDRHMDILATIKFSAPYFGDASNWGVMESENVQRYLDWIYQHELETVLISVRDMVTNELLK